MNQWWILLTGTLGTKFSEILFEIDTFSFQKTNLKMSSRKWRPFCFGLDVLNTWVFLVKLLSGRCHRMHSPWQVHTFTSRMCCCVIHTNLQHVLARSGLCTATPSLWHYTFVCMGYSISTPQRTQPFSYHTDIWHPYREGIFISLAIHCWYTWELHRIIVRKNDCRWYVTNTSGC